MCTFSKKVQGATFINTRPFLKLELNVRYEQGVLRYIDTLSPGESLRCTFRQNQPKGRFTLSSHCTLTYVCGIYK